MKKRIATDVIVHGGRGGGRRSGGRGSVFFENTSVLRASREIRCSSVLLNRSM